MSKQTNFTVNDIDFDDIADNLKQFLNYQQEFTDYNFKGSALSQIIDLLAYNTHYNAVYDSYAVNEAFLNSAIKRENVISHASNLNYIARSNIGATATISLIINEADTQQNQNNKYLPKYSEFTTTIDGKTYSFYNDSTVMFKATANRYTIDNLQIKQGHYVTIQRTFNGDPFQKFVIDSENVDISTLKVDVKHEGIVYAFNPVDNIIDVNQNSKVYFLSVNSRGQYQVHFGSGMFGWSLASGDVVYLTYLATDSDPTAVNGASIFDCSITPVQLGFTQDATINVITNSAATGGTYSESTESIKQLAPKIFTTQNRCVTAADYKSMIMHKFGQAKSINVWGGQDMRPPQYGKVFISVIPKYGTTLTQSDKDKIVDMLEDKKELTKLIEFVDPTYININVDCLVHYNSDLTTTTDNDIVSKVKQTIVDFGEQRLVEFGNVMRFTQLTEAIDNADRSITNNETSIKLSTSISPVYDKNVDYTVEFNNPIVQSVAANQSVISSGFTCMEGGENRVCYIDDDPSNSSLRLFYYDQQNNKVIIKRVGSVDYQTGKLIIDGLTVYTILGQQWTWTITPASFDVVASRNQFAVIDVNHLIVNAINDSATPKYVQKATR